MKPVKNHREEILAGYHSAEYPALRAGMNTDSPLANSVLRGLSRRIDSIAHYCATAQSVLTATAVNPHARHRQEHFSN